MSLNRIPGVARVALAALVVGCGTPTPASDAGRRDVYDNTRLPDGATSPCLGATDCASCTARTPCGFCHNQCVPGTAEGSFDGVCSGAAWLYRGEQCGPASPTCPTHTTCADCATDPNSCGWCANTSHCVSGDRGGPGPAVAGCTPADGTWMYTTGQCP